MSIVDEFSSSFDITIINKENGGSSSARNAGLARSIGKFIFFIDPDDVLEKEMFEALHDEILKKKVDIVMCNMYVEKFGRNLKNSFVEDRIYQIDELFGDFINASGIRSASNIRVF